MVGGRTRARHAPRKAPGTPAELRESWHRTYSERRYHELPWFSRRPYPALRSVIEAHEFERHARVLDIGCGAGTNAMYLASRGFQASGVDLAPGAIRAAEERAARARLWVDFRVGDALRLPFRSRTFDALTDIGCFHTVPIRLRSDYARETARVLRPGGRFLLCWVAREHTSSMGPPHRPSVAEVAEVFEKSFLFRWCRFAAGAGGGIPAYAALLERRRTVQPPLR